jgi:hypothetical protein
MRHKNNNVELGYKCLVLNYCMALLWIGDLKVALKDISRL